MVLSGTKEQRVRRRKHDDRLSMASNVCFPIVSFHLSYLVPIIDISWMYSKDPHLIAWFSAGAFVLLGFPISLYGIVMHLANYNQPETQSYIVRILWMVPLYSVQSWLSLRYNNYAVYIETLRDSYESYVLYSFLQYLIQVLGGEEALILMLKDKSPTRGVHMWGLQVTCAVQLFDV
jgi:Organic solute transporter Ostalpha